MLFNYSGILNSGFLEKLKLANYLASNYRYSELDPKTQEVVKKLEPLKKDIGDILNLEEIAKIREENPKDRLRIPKQYEQGVERARGKYRDEVVNKNIQQMKDEHREYRDPVYAPAENLDTTGDLPDSISNRKIKERTQGLYHKVNRYLAEVTQELEKPENRNNQELKNVRSYLSNALHEITRFMKSKFYTHRLTKSKDPMRMHRAPSVEDAAVMKLNSEDIPDSAKDRSTGPDGEEDPDFYSYMQENTISMDPQELNYQTEKYLEMLDVLELSANEFKASYQKIVSQINKNGYVVGYIEKTFPASFHESTAYQKEFLSKPFGTIWYLTPVSANADLYESEYEETPAQSGNTRSSSPLYQPQLLRTAKDLLPNNFKEKQKAYQAQIGKGMGKKKLQELTDLANGDTLAWENAKYNLKGWKPSHIAKLIKRLDWSSVADRETIDDLVAPKNRSTRKRDMYYDQDVGSDFFDPDQLQISDSDRQYLKEKKFIDEDYDKVMQDNKEFRSSPSNEKKHSYIFVAKIPSTSLDIEKMRDQYEKKKSGIFNAIYVTAGAPVLLTSIVSINLSDDDKEYQAKFNDRKVMANQMPLVGMREVISLMGKRYAMPKSIGWTKEDHLEIFESSAGDMYRLENGKYHLLDDKFMPVKGVAPLTHEQMLAIDPENKPKNVPKTAESLGPNPVQAVPANAADPQGKVVKPVPEKPGVFVNKNKEVYIEQNGALHPIDENGKPGPVDNDVEKTSSLITSALSRLAAQPVEVVVNIDPQSPADCQNDMVSVEEMCSFICNDRDLARKYLKSNIRVVRDEIQFGTYTPEMAVELWKDTVNAGALEWCRRNNCDAEEVFPENLREQLAAQMSQDFYAAIVSGQYTDI